MKKYDKEFKLMVIELCKGNAVESELEKQVKHFRKELKEAQIERDILKKGMHISPRETPNL